MKSSSNNYFLWDHHRCREWDPFGELPHPEWIRTRYFGKVFQYMEESLKEEGLTVYLTSTIKDLPSYGDDVIAVLQEDQPSRVPWYFDRVKATFTCHGTQQSFRPNPFLKPTYANFLAAGLFAGNMLRRIPNKARYAWLRYTNENLPPIYTIPLGYANQSAVAYKPFIDRENDVFFAGSVKHAARPHKLKECLGSPKYYSRNQLVERLRKIKNQYPSVKVDLQIHDTFRASISASAEAYSKSMMNAKICPVPRGTTIESYRFFEAIRFGCIPIVEALPSRWYYDNAPAIQVDDWVEIEEIIPRLLNSPTLLEKKHNEVLEWWEQKCSEKAVGGFIAEKINNGFRAPSFLG